MSKNKHDVPQFDDPQLNRLTQALQANPLPAPPMPAASRQAVRQRLLTGATSPGWHRFRAALGTAVALIVLVSAVAFFWLVQAGQDTAVGPLSAARATSTPETEGAPEGAPDAPANIPEFTAHETAKKLQIEEVDPPAGTLLTGPQPITITFSLQLNGVPTATIRAKVVEMMGGSFRGVAGNDVVVTPEDGRFILIIPFTANELNGPANLGLYVEGRTDPNPRTLANLFINMPGEVLWRYEPENGEQHAVIFNSATQKERHTAMITFEVSLVGPLISTDTGDTGILQLYIAHPNWAENGLIARDALPFSPVSGSTYHLTATPEEIRAATGTDNPVVVAAWALVTERETDLDTLPFTYTTFSACPMDLTRNDAFTCTP